MPTPAPVVTNYDGGIPQDNQTDPVFTTNVFNYLNWQIEEFAPDINAFGSWMEATALEVYATALSGTLPDLTGQAGMSFRVNQAGNGVEFFDALETSEFEATLTGSKQLIEEVDLTGLDVHTFPLHDHSLFIGYVLEIEGVELSSSQTLGFEVLMSRDGGVTFQNTQSYKVNVILFQSTGIAINSDTEDAIRLGNSNTFVGRSQYFNSTIEFKTPHLPGIWKHYTSKSFIDRGPAGGLFYRRDNDGYLGNIQSTQRLDQIRLQDMRQPQSGVARYYGIRA